MTVEIPLSSRKYPGLVALVDDEDYELVAGYTWYPMKHGRTFYAQAHVPGSGHRGKNVRMHRLIRPDIVDEIDHEDRNGLNNTQANLRPANRSHQLANQGKRTGGTSQYKGVSLDKSRGKWAAYIQVARKTVNLGRYDEEIEAARAYDAAAHDHFKEFAALNFP